MSVSAGWQRGARSASTLVEEDVAVAEVVGLRRARQHRLVVVVVPLARLHVARVRRVVARRGACPPTPSRRSDQTNAQVQIHSGLEAA